MQDPQEVRARSRALAGLVSVAALLSLAAQALVGCSSSVARDERDSTLAGPQGAREGTTPTAATPSPMEAEPGALEIGDPYYPGLGNGGYDVQHYTLDLDVDMAGEELIATATIRARALHDLLSFSLDLYGLEVESVSVDGLDVLFERPEPDPAQGAMGAEPSELVIHPQEPIRAGATFETVVSYYGTPDGRPDPSVPFIPKGVGWHWTNSGVYVVSECIGASSWFPCNDHPRDKATYSFRVRVEEPFTAAANGILLDVVQDGDARVFTFEASDPMATYLATLNIAEFGVIEDEGPRGIPIRIYHPLDASERELADFRRQAEVLEFLEGVFGPYPFEAAGGVISYEQIGGALECQTLPVYGRGMSLPVIVHELAHQWYGDAVSPDLWQDMWLNEGFASYAGWLWREHAAGEEAYQNTVRGAYARLRKSKTGSPFDPGVARVFSGRVYTRGAMVLHGLRREVGDEDFFEILQSWAESRGGGNGSTDEFVRHAAEIAGRDLTDYFDTWLYSAVTPEVAEYEPTPESGQSGRRERPAEDHDGGEHGDHDEHGEHDDDGRSAQR